jgi:putative ABC transport system ATP-binding protein
LERLGVSDVAKKLPGAMSGGQAQRVAVARALACQPHVIFADEPTGALDQANGEVVVGAMIEAAQEQGAAVVLVTHDPGVASRADRQVRLRDGRTLTGTA